MNDLSNRIVSLIIDARSKVASFANSAMVITYFEIGKMIVEELQNGEKRAEYGANLLKIVSNDLTSKNLKGFSVPNLERMRNFYAMYSISSNDLRNSKVFLNSSNHLRISENNDLVVRILSISWSHYMFLMRIEDEKERQFYEVESFLNHWKLKDLERQFNSGLFERISLSKNKEEVLQIIKNGQVVENFNDILKEPLILEFLGLEEKECYSETDLETAIINHIEKFMLELGKGFFFGGRQVRFTFEEEHFRVDLVFYNRLLQCFVLIDLKIGKLTHQDLGQMQMYVNYYDRFVKSETENPTIGVILCKDKKQALVEITLPENNSQIYASKYQTILPSKEDFQHILNDYE
ncbi:YhcG family protein [Flavobacterium sp.]|jgi:predicted nuclease of restriction endonuclease-like (RecB) superfamily|uniref:YhcG family protein n=1 Tax=Flavobacterium sp. TaxID=239 RepID=UPI0037BF6A5C